MKALHNTYYNILEKCAVFTNHIHSGSANTLLSVLIITVVSFGIINSINDNNLAMKKEESNRLIKLATIEAEARLNAVKYNANIKETDYTVPSHAPVNVYIDTRNTKYTIGATDSATEISISTIKVKSIKYTTQQQKLLTDAFRIGKEVGFPETIQSLLLQETRAGAYGDRIGDISLPVGKRSYGVMQIKEATARKVLKKRADIVLKYFPKRKTYKRLRGEEIIIKLIQDDEFNIRLAALNFAMHRERSQNWAHAVVAYNTGQFAANKIQDHKQHDYYNHVVKKLISEVRPFNKKTKLSL